MMQQSLICLLALAAGARADAPAAFDAAKRAPAGAVDADLPPFQKARTVAGADGARVTHLQPMDDAAAAAEPTWGAGNATAALGAERAGLDGWPKHVASLLPGAAPVTVEGACFKNTTMAFTIDPATRRGKLMLEYRDAASRACADIYLMLTARRWSVQHEFFSGTHTVMWFPFESEAEYADAAAHGVRVVLWTGTWKEELGFLYQLFRVGVLQNWGAIRDFLAEKVNIHLTKRAANTLLVPRAEDIAAGDVFAAFHPSMASLMIGYATGRAVGHSAMVLELDGELWLCENNAKGLENFIPGPDGIQRTRLAEWLATQHRLGMMVWWLPLGEAERARFDKAAAAAWFRRHEGEPYGWPIVLGTGVDSVTHSLPPPMTPDLLFTGAALAQHLGAAGPVKQQVMTPLAAKLAYYYHDTAAWDCEDMACLLARAAAAGVAPIDLAALPETDALLYPTAAGAKQAQYICSTMVTKLLQVGGVLPGTLDANEFTPRDVAELAIYRQRPSYCPANDGTVGCFLLGEYMPSMAGHGTVPPYAHMNTKCGIAPPAYDKFPEGC